MTKEAFLNTLTIQREKLKSQYEKPGWNKWALIGALASLIWIFLDLLEKNHNTIPTNSVTILILFLFCEHILLIPIHPLNSFFKKKSNKYINLKHEFNESFLVYLFTFGTLLFTLLFTSYKINFTNIYFEKITFYFLLTILVFYSIFSLSFFIDIHLHVNNNKNNNIFRATQLYTFIFGIYAFTGYLFSIDDFENIIIYKYGFIFIGIYYTFSALIIAIQKNPLLDQIDKLIDDTTLDEISIEEAKKQLRIIINGLQFNDILQPMFNEHLKINQIFIETCHKINLILSPEKKEEVTNAEKFKLTKDLVDELDKQIIPRLNKSISKINTRLLIYEPHERNNPHYLELKKTFENLESERRILFIDLINKLESISTKS